MILPCPNKCFYIVATGLENSTNNHDSRTHEDSETSAHPICKVWDKWKSCNTSYTLYNGKKGELEAVVRIVIFMI